MKYNLTLFAAVCCVSLCVCQDSLGQSYLFLDGQNGFGIAGSLESGEDYTSVGAKFAFSAAGRFDFGVEVGKASFDESEYGEDFTATQFSPFASAILVRPNESSPVGVIARAAFGTTSFSGDDLDALQWELGSTSYIAGGVLYLELESSPGLTVFPAVGVGYASVTATLEDSFGVSVDDEVQELLISGSVTFFLNQQMFITPSFTTFDGSSSWSVTAGIAIPFK
jgi:hypothetical protein